MENKIPEGLLNIYDSMLSAQLRVVRQRKPLPISAILAQVKVKLFP